MWEDGRRVDFPEMEYTIKAHIVLKWSNAGFCMYAAVGAYVCYLNFWLDSYSMWPEAAYLLAQQL